MRLILAALSLALFSLIGADVCLAQVLSEGYCGRDAARACVRDLGLAWRSTPSADQLESSPYASFGELTEAFESLGLHVLTVSIDRTNIAAIRTLLQANAGQTSGIAWLSADDSEEHPNESVPGHFVVAASITDDEKVTYYDAQTNIVRQILIEGDDYLPLLIVSKQPLERATTYAAMTHLARTAMSSPCATASLLIIALLLLVGPAPGDRKVSLPIMGATSLVLLLAVTGFLFLPTLENMGGSNPRKDDTGLAFSSEVYNAGEMFVDSGDAVDVTLVNDTDKHVAIEKIMGSCGCMGIEPDHATLNPGESVVCSVSFSTIRSGKNDYVVTAVNGDEAIRCSITFDGIDGVALLPRRKVAGQLNPSSDGSLIHVLKITNYRGAPLNDVVLVERSRDRKLNFELLPDAIFAKDRTLSIRVQITEGFGFRGLHFETLQVKAGTGEQAVSCLVEIGVEVTGSPNANGG